MPNLFDLTRKKLVELAKKHQLTGYSRMRKDELIRALSSLTERVAEKTRALAESRDGPGSRGATKSHPTVWEASGEVEREPVIPVEARPQPPGTPQPEMAPEEKVVVPPTATPPHPTAPTRARPPEITANELPHAPVPEPATTQEPLGELPQRYGENRVVLMVRDPYWLFCYWEIKRDTLDRNRSQLAEPTSVLRVFDVTEATHGGGVPAAYDIEVGQLEAGDWYIHVPQADRAYVVELGFRDRDGRFLTLMRSNVGRTPPAGVSHLIDDRFVNLDLDYPLAPDGRIPGHQVDAQGLPAGPMGGLYALSAERVGASGRMPSSSAGRPWSATVSTFSWR